MNSKLLVKCVFFFLIGTMTITSSSCKKDVTGCTDSSAENFNAEATISGDCTYARDKFLGSYNINENCSSGNYSYSSSIVESSSGKDAVIINNFGDYGVNVRATITGENVNVNDTQNSITFSGSGNINGSTLTIIYTASVGGALDNCTMNCIKQ